VTELGGGGRTVEAARSQDVISRCKAAEFRTIAAD